MLAGSTVYSTTFKGNGFVSSIHYAIRLYSSFDCRHFKDTFHHIVGVINFSTPGAIISGYLITTETAETEQTNKKVPNL